MEKIITDYLTHLNVPISEKYCEKSIVSHPDYPSLLSIADTLERLGIEYQIGEVENNVEELPLPCVLQLDRSGGELLFVKDKNDLEFHRADLQKWNNIILKINATDSIADEENNKRLTREKKQKKLIISMGVALMGLFVLPSLISGVSLLELLFGLTVIAGIVMGYLLLAKNLGITFKPVETFCNAGKRTNCDRILNAEDANLFGIFTFTDAAASYFGFQFFIAGLIIPLAPDSGAYWSGLAVASVFTLPVIGYSIYYQQFKAKTWCRLCLLVDGILAIQAGLIAAFYVNGYFATADAALLPLFLSLSVFAAILSAIILFKNHYEKTKESARAETSAKRVKYDPKVFTSLLFNEDRVDATPFQQEMRLGSSSAPIQILMILNLHCHPCSIAFETVGQLLKAYPNKISVRIRLLYSGRNTIGDLPVSSYLIRYWQQRERDRQGKTEQIQRLLADWYNTMNVESFAARYSANGELIHVNDDLETQHYRWITENNIARTPTFFINGYEMPKGYRVNDLMLMVPGLAEIFNDKQTEFQPNELV